MQLVFGDSIEKLIFSLFSIKNFHSSFEFKIGPQHFSMGK